MGTGFMSSITTISSMLCAANRFAEGEPPVGQALCNAVYRDNLFPRTEYVEAWKVLQRDLPRRDACRRMVDLLFIAHERACEAELAHLLAADLACGTLPDPEALERDGFSWNQEHRKTRSSPCERQRFPIPF